MISGFSRGEAPDSLHPLITEVRESGNAWYVAARHYPTDDVEVIALRLGPDDRMRSGGGAARKNTDKESMDDHVQRKSAQRAVTTVRRKALSMSADRMLTLTFRENVVEIDQAWRVFKYFCRLMRWRFADRWVYIAAPERQTRGAIHFHLAIKGYFPVSTVRRLWIQACGEKGGNVDIASSKKEMGKRSWNPRRIAQYIAGYITKVDIVEFNRKRYSTGGSIQMPEPVRGWLSCGVPVVSVLRQIVESKSRLSVVTIREGEAFWPFHFLSTA